MNRKNDTVFTDATVEVIHFDTEDILTSSNPYIDLPWDEFSLRDPDLGFLSALENAENE